MYYTLSVVLLSVLLVQVSHLNKKLFYIQKNAKAQSLDCIDFVLTQMKKKNHTTVLVCFVLYRSADICIQLCARSSS